VQKRRVSNENWLARKIMSKKDVEHFVPDISCKQKRKNL
jgi:hypothetical protein